jgi:hypothetical protein
MAQLGYACYGADWSEAGARGSGRAVRWRTGKASAGGGRGVGSTWARPSEKCRARCFSRLERPNPDLLEPLSMPLDDCRKIIFSSFTAISWDCVYIPSRLRSNDDKSHKEVDYLTVGVIQSNKKAFTPPTNDLAPTSIQIRGLAKSCQPHTVALFHFLKSGQVLPRFSEVYIVVLSVEVPKCEI